MTGKRRNYLASYVVAGPDNCWNYSGSIGANGYGRILQTTAHRWFYEALVGPVPAGLSLDHLCENRACVNPSHLEPVTTGENTYRSHQPIGCCARCGQAVGGGVSTTLRQRGNPSFECSLCADARVRWEAGSAERAKEFGNIDLLDYFRRLAEASQRLHAPS